jgi:methionyl-tRNA synthetase
VLWHCAAVSASLLVLLGPFTPGVSRRGWAQVGLEGSPFDAGRWAAAGAPLVPDALSVGEPKPLLQKLVPEEVARLRAIVTQPPDLREVLGLPPRAETGA